MLIAGCGGGSGSSGDEASARQRLEAAGRSSPTPTPSPASTFPGAEGLGDSDVDFEATIDGKGFLTQIVIRGEADGAEATATETYERINSDLGITPPPASDVHGTVRRLDSKGELEALLGSGV